MIERFHIDRLRVDDLLTPQRNVSSSSRSCRFTDSEVKKILNKYGIEPQKTVHEDEAKQMFRDVLQNAPESSKLFIIIICLYDSITTVYRRFRSKYQLLLATTVMRVWSYVVWTILHLN